MRVKILFRDDQEIEFSTRVITNISPISFESIMVRGRNPMSYTFDSETPDSLDFSKLCDFSFKNLKIKSIFVFMEETEGEENETQKS